MLLTLALLTGSRDRASAQARAPTVTAVTPFTDDPLQAGVTAVKAQHVIELRQAVDNVRSVAALPAATWTDDTLAVDSTLVRVAHVVELRARLDEALAALGYTPAPYTDPALSSGATAIRAVHIQEIRDRLKRLPPFCAYALSPLSLAVAAGGGSGDVTVSTADACDWAATPNVAWITILGAPSGTGRAMIGFSAEANPTTSARAGVIKVAAQVFTVSQAAGSSRILVTHPASPSTYGPGESVTLTAAVDPANHTSLVGFYVDSNLVGTSLGPPFAVPWSTGAVGVHLIAAVAENGLGLAAAPLVTVTVVNCAPIDPTDDIPDDAGLQCRLNQGGTIELQPGSPGYIVDGSPSTDGYANGRGVYIKQHGTHLTANPFGGDILARIIAGPDLWGDILRTDPDPAMDGTGVHDVEIDHIVFDGRVDVLVGGLPLRIHREECDTRGSGNLTLNVHGLRFHDNQTTNAMCGTSLQLFGLPNDGDTPAFPFVLERNYIAGNGRDYRHLGSGARWADGITLLWCDRGTIVNNLFADNTDIDFTIGGSSNCTVAFNTIAHFHKYAFTGLNIGSSAGGIAGDHAGSNFTDNTIYTGRSDTLAEPQACVPFGTLDPGLIENQLSIGILIGSHPWASTVWVTNGGTLARNKSHHNVMNLVVDGVCAGTHDVNGNCPSSSPPGVTIENNVPSCPRGTLGKGQCHEGGHNFTFNPDHTGSTAGWQPGYENLWYDNDKCSASGPVP